MYLRIVVVVVVQMTTMQMLTKIRMGGIEQWLGEIVKGEYNKILSVCGSSHPHLFAELIDRPLYTG